MTGVEAGLWIAVTLHVSGFFGSFLSGYAADRFGAKPILVGFALVGAACSLVVGWPNELNVALLLVLVGIYGFAIIGDSSVLSSAMTDAIPASQLGRALDLRSILGVGGGRVAHCIRHGARHDTRFYIVGAGFLYFSLRRGAGFRRRYCAAEMTRLADSVAEVSLLAAKR